ncbi:MAG: hypothetical protein O3A46_10640, partial [Candidatus Poribacteria bacterium]|nr:hypothetical protein [Candidatus Poribacteria bacterium]
ANGALVGYKRDRASRLVSSRLNAALLREIVDAADGEVELVTSNRSVEPFLDSMTRVENVARRRRVQPFQTAMALIAIVCLLADVWAGGGYRRET